MNSPSLVPPGGDPGPGRPAESLRRRLAGWDGMTPGRREKLLRDIGLALAVEAGLSRRRLAEGLGMAHSRIGEIVAEIQAG